MSSWNGQRQQRRDATWCERHWAPYRQADAAGRLPDSNFAAVRMLERFVYSPLRAEVDGCGPSAVHRALASADVPLYCQLGDATMDAILQQARRLVNWGADA